MKITYVSVRDQIQKAVAEQSPGKRIEKITLDADEWAVLYHELRESTDEKEVAVSAMIDAGFSTASVCDVPVTLARA